MFLILNSSNLIVDISEYANYVRTQNNGITVFCEKEKADAIYSANTDKFYPLEHSGYLGDSFTMVEIDEVSSRIRAGYHYFISGEFYVTVDGESEELRELKKAYQILTEGESDELR